jgi:hypothetical protein
MIRRRFLLLGAILSGIAMAALATPARADFVLIISDSAGQSVVADQTTGTITAYNGASFNSQTSYTSPGLISVQASMGVFALTITTALGNPLIGTSSLDIQNLTVDATGGGALTVTAYQTGDSITPAPTTPTGVMMSSIGGTSTGASISAATYFDSTDQGNIGVLPSFSAPGTSTPGLVYATAPIVGNFGTSMNTQVNLPANNLFAIVDTATLTFTSGGSSTYDLYNTVIAPAPDGLVLAMSALPMFGLFCVRRRLKNAVA